MLKLPKTLGARIDLVYKLRAERIEKERGFDLEISALKAQELEVKQAIITELKAAKLEQGSGSTATAAVQVKLSPRPVDWGKLYKWVEKTGAFEIFERRISRAAFLERYEAGVTVPGVEVFQSEDLSLTKR
jgi:hypothetical protein